MGVVYQKEPESIFSFVNFIIFGHCKMSVREMGGGGLLGVNSHRTQPHGPPRHVRHMSRVPSRRTGPLPPHPPHT